MRHPTTLTATVSGLVLLACVSIADTRPKQTPAPTKLNVPEHVCLTLGSVAYKQAEARDAGVSYLALVNTMRQIPTPPALTFLTSLMDTVLRLMYARPDMTPSFLRRETELTCLRELEQYLTSIATPTTR